MAAERDVIYRLKAIYDTSGSQAFAAMASQHAASLKTMEDRWKAYDAAVKAAAGSQASSVGQSYSKQKNHAKEFYDYVGAENKKLVDAIKARERAEEQARRTQERALAQTRAGNAMMREGLMNTAEGVTRVTRGLALMGFVSDENLQKLLKTLAAVQGISDVVLGSVKAYSALQKAVDGYTLAVSAARTAEAGRAGVAAAGSAGGVGAAGGIGLGGLALGSVAAAGAIAGLTLVLAELAETAHGTALETGSLTSSVGLWLEETAKKFGFTKERFGGSTPFMDARDAARNAAAQSSRNVSQTQFDRELPVQLEAARRAGFDRTLGAGMGFGASKAGMIGQEIAGLGGYAASSLEKSSFTSGADQLSQHGEAVKAYEAMLDLTQKRAAEEDRIRQTSIGYHQTAISAAQQELAIIKQQQDADASRLETARDRFGMMSTMEQSRALRLGKLANQANELRSSGRTAEARRIEDRFTRDDLGIIRGIGTEGTDAFGGRVSGERAERSGFSGVFGAEERKRAAELAPRIESLIAETTVNVEARFKLELDQEQARSALESAMKPIIEQLNKLGAEQVRLRLNQEKAVRDNANTAARRNAGG